MAWVPRPARAFPGTAYVIPARARAWPVRWASWGPSGVLGLLFVVAGRLLGSVGRA